MLLTEFTRRASTRDFTVLETNFVYSVFLYTLTCLINEHACLLGTFCYYKREKRRDLIPFEITKCSYFDQKYCPTFKVTQTLFLYFFAELGCSRK